MERATPEDVVSLNLYSLATLLENELGHVPIQLSIKGLRKGTGNTLIKHD
jgi:hypothetical protein